MTTADLALPRAKTPPFGIPLEVMTRGWKKSDVATDAQPLELTTRDIGPLPRVDLTLSRSSR
jgi:hypothetical protein